jgi:hypothetical protein
VSTIWLERFVLGGVCTAVFVAIAVLDVMKLDWIQRSTLGGAVVLFSYFIGHTIEKKRGDSTPPPIASAPSLLPTKPPNSDAPKEVSPAPTDSASSRANPRHTKPQASTASRPLTSFSDGQRFVLKQKLREIPYNTVRLVLIGNDPQAGIVFEQLVGVFNDAGWAVQTAQIGTVAIVGANFPHVPYLTSPNIAAPVVGNVFSIFAAVGIDLPLTPDAFMGPDSMGGTPPDIIIVVQ